MSFTLRQVRYFVAVAEVGSMTAASRELLISQSAITEAMRDLEEDLNTTLFSRHARGLKLTSKGYQFLRHANSILASVENARRAVQEGESDVEGVLNLGLTPLVSSYVIADTLARFRATHPAVAMSVSEDSVEYIEHLLVGGELDIAVMTLPTGWNNPALQAEVLTVSTFRLWLPHNHALAKRTAIELTDLQSEPLIMLEMEETEIETEALLAQLGRWPHIAFRTRAAEAVRSFVATGAGVALLPDLIYRPRSLEGDHIDSRDVSGSLPTLKIGLVWRRGTSLSRQAHAFASLAISSGPK